MSCFHELSSFWQLFLLVASEFTVIALACCVVVAIKRHFSPRNRIFLALLLLVNAALYVVIQMDRTLGAGEQVRHLSVPYWLIVLITAGSLIWSAFATLSETQKRKTINHNSIKEAFDTLPMGVCFFNASGLPVLCNQAMHRFCFAICGKDVQYITDLEVCLEDYNPVTEARREEDVFILPDGSAWQLDARVIADDGRECYAQFVALNVTDLYKNSLELERDNEQLRQVQRNLQKLSANVVAATREEEILAMKMRVHDEMGKCLAAAQKYLGENTGETIPDSMAASWQRAVNMLKFNNRESEEDMLAQIRKTCELVKMDFVTEGSLPEERETAYLLTCAVRECVTNAVRYAKATELRAVFSEVDGYAVVAVTNNGLPPEKEIREGGGLSTLRRRVELAGGHMLVQSLPVFKLTVKLPKGKENVL